MPIARRALLAATLLVLAAGQSACINSVATVRGSQTSTLAHVEHGPLWVETANGSVEVLAAQGREVTIHADIRARSAERLAQTTLMADRHDDGTLKVWIDWPGGERLSNEGASLAITLPDAQGVTIVTSNGAIRVEGIDGDADLTSSNGAISAIDQGGAVGASTSNGRVTITRPAGAVAAKSSNGRIVVEDAPAGVDVRTSNGSVAVSLRSDATGPVNLVSSNGAMSLVVGEAFAGTLTVSTSNGRLSLPQRGAEVVSRSRSGATLRFAAAESPASRVATSNGSVTVEVR